MAGWGVLGLCWDLGAGGDAELSSWGSRDSGYYNGSHA